jgi:predicted dithiol-disulfide oxidoreductase (DUF899 family)
MNRPEIVSRAEWLGARKALLAREKEFTRQRDKLNAERRRLPMVRIDKDYLFEGPHGRARLLDLFEGRQQLEARVVLEELSARLPSLHLIPGQALRFQPIEFYK